ncbi:MAG: VWA domain-containing protein [Nitriliruptoraceae bacterium]
MTASEEHKGAEVITTGTTQRASRQVPRGLVETVTDLHATLRSAGVVDSPSSLIAALHALGEVSWIERAEFREALATTMVTSQRARGVFNDAFDLYFPADGSGRFDFTDADDPATSATPDATAPDGPSELDGDDDALLDALVEAIRNGDDDAIAALARRAVGRFGQIVGRDGSVAWFQYRVRRALDPGLLLRRLRASGPELDAGEIQAPATDASQSASRSGSTVKMQASPDGDAWWQGVVDTEYQARIRAFERHVEAEIRRRTAAQRGPKIVASRAAGRAIEDRDFLALDAAERRRLREEIRPLARKIATRLAVKRRRGRGGRLDMRRTVRASLATGGVPFHVVRRPLRAHRSELVVLCDVSGSVASFARFTLMLVHALQEQIGRVRSFAFVDAVDEVTAAMEHHDLERAVGRLGLDAKVVGADGHSDYGTALGDFYQHYRTTLTPRTTVLILGDARNNYRQANAWVLKDLRSRVRRIWWLNPEARTFWDTGDSIASAYARHVDEMVEVRNLRQLATFVERLG